MIITQDQIVITVATFMGLFLLACATLVVTSMIKENGDMPRKATINDLASALARSNKGKKDVSVAQVSEILKDLNKFCGGQFYPWFKKMNRMRMYR